MVMPMPNYPANQPMTENAKTPVESLQKTAWDTENSEAHSGNLRACFEKLDRFGDSDPRQRTIVGFVFSVVFWIILCAYAVSKYMLYQSRPPQQRSDTIWSVSQGPYHFRSLVLQNSAGCR